MAGASVCRGSATLSPSGSAWECFHSSPSSRHRGSVLLYLPYFDIIRCGCGEAWGIFLFVLSGDHLPERFLALCIWVEPLHSVGQWVHNEAVDSYGVSQQPFGYNFFPSRLGVVNSFRHAFGYWWIAVCGYYFGSRCTYAGQGCFRCCWNFLEVAGGDFLKWLFLHSWTSRGGDSAGII